MKSFKNETLAKQCDEKINYELPLMISSNPTTSSNHRFQRPTHCSVCDRPANGFHYDVPSCKGCKAFFRRIIIAEKQLECKFDGDCFDLSMRENTLKCRACRYKKCIEVGMNHLALQVNEDEEKSEEFRKLTRKRENSIREENEDLKCEKTSKLLRVLATRRDRNQDIIDSLIYLEDKLEQFRYSAFNPEPTKIPDLKNLIASTSLISVACNLGPMKWSTTPRPLPPPPRPDEKPMPAKINYDPCRKRWLDYDLMTMVEYSKTFMFFNKLDLKDRVRLLRHGALACLNLHVSFQSISRNFDEYIFPDPTHTRRANTYNKSVMSIQPLIRYNVSKTEYILLKAILLCNPAVTDLSEHAQNILMNQRKEYANALFDYCLSKKNLGPSHFVLLIGIIDTLEHQQKMQKDLHVFHILPMFKHIPRSKRCGLVDDIMDN